MALFRDTSWFGTATHSATRSTRTVCALDVNDIAMGNCIPPLSPLHAPGGRRERAPRARRSRLVPRRSRLVPHGRRQDRLPPANQARLVLRVLAASAGTSSSPANVTSRHSSTSSAACPSTARRASRSSATSSRCELQPTQTATTPPKKHRRPQERLGQADLARALAGHVRHVTSDVVRLAPTAVGR